MQIIGSTIVSIHTCYGYPCRLLQFARAYTALHPNNVNI